MDEDTILTRVTIEAELEKLHPAERAMMLLIYKIDQPEDWTGPWPPKYEAIGRYIGLKFEGRPLSEAAIRYRRDAVLGVWKGTRGKLRRNRKVTRP